MVLDLVGRKEGLGFHPEGSGSPGGRWAEEEEPVSWRSQVPSSGRFREDWLGVSTGFRNQGRGGLSVLVQVVTVGANQGTDWGRV